MLSSLKREYILIFLLVAEELRSGNLFATLVRIGLTGNGRCFNVAVL